MKKILRLMALAALGLGACAEQPQPLKIDNALTPAEIEAGLLTPEILWKMGRAGSASLSPDGSKLLYAVTRYNLAENCGRTQIYVRDMASGEVSELTDLCSENNSPAWSADGRTIRFLSDRSGSMQVWEMNPEGGDLRQLSRLDGDIEGFGISPRGDKAWYVRRVQVCDRKSSDVYKDMPHSKARIYDDLMSRHWDYWDEGWYRHIFVADFDGDRIAEGADILGADAAYDAPLAPYFDMAEIAWNHAGTMLAYTCKPLAGTDYALTTDSDVFVYDVASGLTQNICKPRNFGLEGAPVINPGAMPGYDKYPVWSPDDLRIAFRSMRQPGFESDKQRLFLYDCRTGELEDLTPEFDYNALNVVWENDDTLWFAAPIEATHQLCRLHLPDGRVEVVTRGDHDIKTFTMAGGRLVAELCTISSAAEYYEVNPADGALTKISDINGDIYGHIRMGEVQKRWVPTTDGKRMLVWVILPPDFDPAKKYPTLLYCEGGPQNVVSQFWSYRWNFQLMAAATWSWRPTAAAFPRSVRSGSNRSRATTRVRTSATTWRRSTTWPGSPGPTRRTWAAWAPPTAATRSTTSPGTTKAASRRSSRTAASSTSRPCTARPRSSSSSTTTTEAPTGTARTPWRSAPTPTRPTVSWRSGTRRSWSSRANTTSASPTRSRSKPSPPRACTASRRVWWISRTRATRCSSRRTRWCGTANSSAGSTAT